MAGIILLTIFYLAHRKDLIQMICVLISVGSYPLALVLKGLFHESRPTGFNPIVYVKWDVYSFPSAHTMFYIAFFGCIIYLTFALKGMDKVLRHTIRLLSSVLVASVGASRIALGAHFIRDVIFGYLFGLVYLALVIMLEKSLAQKQAKRLPTHK